MRQAYARILQRKGLLLPFDYLSVFTHRAAAHALRRIRLYVGSSFRGYSNFHVRSSFRGYVNFHVCASFRVYSNFHGCGSFRGYSNFHGCASFSGYSYFYLG